MFQVTIFNTIITNNSADSLGNQICAEVSDSTYPMFLFISHCNLDTADCYFDVGAGELIFGDGIINVNPFFADNIFHLSDSSACIDVGAESVYVSFWDTVIYAPTTDFEGDIRPIGGGWDIGADEFNPTAVNERKINIRNITLLSYPNPFTKNCRISLPAGCFATIVDVSGRILKKFSEAEGKNFIVWAPDEDTEQGIYFVNVYAQGRHIGSKKIIYLK